MPENLRRAFASGGLFRAFVFATFALAGFYFWEGTILLIPVILCCALVIYVKRWIESRFDPNPPLPNLAVKRPFNRDPLGYLGVAGTVVRVMLFFVLFGMFVGMYGEPHSPFYYGHGLNVELAKATHPEKKATADREDAIFVVLQRDGRVYFYTQEFGPEQANVGGLSQKITSAVRRGSEKRVYIKADTRARYRLVKDVVDEIRDSGIEHITFIVQQVNSQGPIEEFHNILKP